MYPRTADAAESSAVDVATRRSEHYLTNTDVILQSRDEVRQLSKELIGQSREVADRMDKSIASLAAFYTTFGRMADILGKSYTGNKEIGQELIRVAARHKETCQILSDISATFRSIGGSSRSSSPDTGTSRLDVASKQFQKECESNKKEKEELTKYLENMGFKYGGTIRKNHKVRKMSAKDTQQYTSNAERTKDLFVKSLISQRKFMCFFYSQVQPVLERELDLIEKLGGLAPLCDNLKEFTTGPGTLPEATLKDIALAGEVNTDVVFKSTQSHSTPSGSMTGSGGVSEFDSISQTSSLGSSTSLSTNSSVDSPGGTNCSYADSGIPSSRESVHDDPDYRDNKPYMQTTPISAIASAISSSASAPPPHAKRTPASATRAPPPLPPQRKTSQSSYTTYSVTQNSENPAYLNLPFNPQQRPISSGGIDLLTNHVTPSMSQSASATWQHSDRNSFIGGTSQKDSKELTTQDELAITCSDIQRQFSGGGASLFLDTGDSAATAGGPPPGKSRPDSDIWVPRTSSPSSSSVSSRASISKSQSSSTDTLEGDSPYQRRRCVKGANESLNSSTDTLDESSCNAMSPCSDQPHQPFTTPSKSGTIKKTPPRTAQRRSSLVHNYDSDSPPSLDSIRPISDAISIGQSDKRESCCDWNLSDEPVSPTEGETALQKDLRLSRQKLKQVDKTHLAARESLSVNNS